MIALATSSQFLPSLPISAISQFSKLIESAIDFAKHTDDDAVSWDYEKDRIMTQWCAEGVRIANLWDSFAGNPCEIFKISGIGESLKTHGSGVLAPMTNLQAKPGETTLFWHPAGRSWSYSPGLINGAGDWGDVRDSDAYSAHELMSMMRGEGLLGLGKIRAEASVLSGLPLRPWATFRPGLTVNPVDKKLYQDGIHIGYLQKFRGCIQHLSIGYDGKMPAISIWEEGDRIRLEPLARDRRSFSSHQNLDEALEAWISLAADLDAPFCPLKNSKHLILSASKSRLAVIERNIGALPHTDKDMVMAALGRVYNKTIKEIANLKFLVIGLPVTLPDG